MPLFKTSNPALGSDTFGSMSDNSYGGGVSSAQYLHQHDAERHR
jgi:hypothetical protein